MQDMHCGRRVLILKKKKIVAGQFVAVNNRSQTYCQTKKLNRQDYGGRQVLLFFFSRLRKKQVSTLLNILHIRLSFGIVHPIIVYSTNSKITVRP